MDALQVRKYTEEELNALSPAQILAHVGSIMSARRDLAEMEQRAFEELDSR